MVVVVGDTDETAQGALQLGPQQIPETGRPHRAGAEGTARTLEPVARSAKRRPINIPHDPTESQLHQSVAELLDWILIEPAFYTTFPAGWGKLSKGTAGRLFASGLKKGMPDILVFDKNQKVIGIELKAGKNGVSSAQRAMFAQLQAVGITVYVCRTQEDVLAALYRENIACRGINHARANAEVPF